MNLDSQAVLSGPFASETPLFLAFADRAIPLCSSFARLIGAVVRVPFRASGFCGVDSGLITRIQKGILGSRYQPKMARIHARTIRANVIHDHLGRDFVVSREPSDSMRSSVASAQIEAAITISIKRALPQPTTTRSLRDFGLKTFLFGRREVHGLHVTTWTPRTRGF